MLCRQSLCRHTNAVGVLFNASIVNGGKVVVDDVHDITNVDTSRADTSGNEDGSVTRSKGSHGGLSLLLGTFAVDGSDWELEIEEEIIKVIGFDTTVDKNDGSHSMHLLEEANEDVTLFVSLGLQDDLLDVGSSASGTTNTEANMRCAEVLLGKVTSVLGESRGEKAILDIALILLCTQCKPMVNSDEDYTWYLPPPVRICCNSSPQS